MSLQTIEAEQGLELSRGNKGLYGQVFNWTFSEKSRRVPKIRFSIACGGHLIDLLLSIAFSNC